VPPESRDIGTRIYNCSLDNEAAKHNSPTTNDSWERCVTRELEPLWKVFTIQSSENLLKEYSRSQCSDSDQPERFKISPEEAVNREHQFLAGNQPNQSWVSSEAVLSRSQPEKQGSSARQEF
jgi:hypothetical protein